MTAEVNRQPSVLNKRISKLFTKKSPCSECENDSSDSDRNSTPEFVKEPLNIIERLHEMESYEVARIDTSQADPKSFQDYAAVGVLMACLPGYLIYDSLANAISGAHRRPARDAFLDSMMGRCYRSSTLRQLRILCGLRTLESELASPLYWIDSSTKLPNYNTEFKASGCAARWICEVPDRKMEDPVILYFHGGGYALKTCQPQVAYMAALAKQLRAKFPRISVLVLDYSIAPFAVFPMQRNQAVACLKALQESSKNVIVMGDSCGANLVLSMLQEESKLKYDHLLGCVLISPWVDLEVQSGSMDSKKDILSKSRLNEMSAQFITPDQITDPKVSPLFADPDVWQRVLPKNTIEVWGSLECLADQSKAFQEKAQIKDFYIEEKGTHDCILRGIKPKPCRYIHENLVKWIESTGTEVRTSKKTKTKTKTKTKAKPKASTE